jgi:GAF domain-containing protein
MEILLRRGKVSVNRLFNWLLNRMKTERGILEVIWLARFSAFLLLLWYFLILFPVEESKKKYIFLILILFFLYNLGVGFTGLQKYARYINKNVKLIQIIIEIAIYSLFYYLSGNANSSIYFLYFLPLLVAAGLLDFLPLIMVMGLAGLGVFGVVSLLAPLPNALAIYGPRIAFMLLLTLFFAAWSGWRRQVTGMQEERARWLQTYLDLSKQLATYDEPENLLRLVATEAQNRLRAETAAVFLLDGERLVRRAEAGIEPDWFPEESYRIGEGLTGKCLIPAPGERYGRPVRENDVDLSHEVIPAHLNRYRQKLASHQVKHLVAVPLNDRKRSFGVLRVVNRQKEEGGLDASGFTQEDEDFLAGIAAITAVAIAYAHQVEEVRRRGEELRRLYEAAQVIASDLERRQMLKRIIDIATKVVASDLTGVLLVDEDGKPITSVESQTMPVPLHQRLRPRGATWRILTTREWYNVSDTRLHPDEHNPVIFQEGYLSYAGIPLISQDRVYGVLFVHSRQLRAFDEHKEILMAFAHQIAVAVHNAQLYEQKQEETNALQKFAEVAEILIKHTSVQELYDYCVKAGKDIFNVEDCSLYIIDENKNTVDLVASSTIPPEIWQRRESRLDGPGLTPYVARTGTWLNLAGDEIEAHPAWAGHQTEPFREHLHYLPSRRSHSLLIGPLLDRHGHIVGVLKLENRQGEAAGKRFSTFQESLHRTYASHIATAIERARLWARLDEDAVRRARKSLEFDLHEMKNFMHGAIVLPIGNIRKHLSKGRYDQAICEIEHVSWNSRSMTDRLDSLMGDVREYLPVLVENGLVVTLHQLAATMGIRIKIKSKVTKRPNYNIEHALYRISKEALINYKKHSSTSEHCLITFYVDEDDRVELEISDKGVGFDNADILEREDATGIQLMKYWADEIGAHFCIRSRGGLCRSTPCPGHRGCEGQPYPGEEQGTTIRVIRIGNTQEVAHGRSHLDPRLR